MSCQHDWFVRWEKIALMAIPSDAECIKCHVVRDLTKEERDALANTDYETEVNKMTEEAIREFDESKTKSN